MKKLLFPFVLGAVALMHAFLYAADTPPDGVTLTDLTGLGNGTASSMYTTGWTDGSAATVFDNNFDNRSIYENQTLDWRWTFNSPTVVNAYKLYSCKSDYYYYDRRMPKNWRLEAKNAADSDWTILDTRTNESTKWAAKEGRYFQCGNTVAYDTYRIISTATIEGGSGHTQIAELEFFCVVPAGAPQFASCSVERSSGDAFTAAVTLEDVAAEVKVLCYTSSETEPTVTSLGEVEAEGTRSTELSALAANTTYSVAFAAANDDFTITNGARTVIYTGVPTLALVSNGEERGCVPAKVRVSRASADPYSLEVHYSVSSLDGVAGVDFESPSGVVTIPANSESVDIEVVPLINSDKKTDTAVTVSLAEGHYYTTGSQSVDVLIKNAEIPNDANYWVAGADSDGLASTSENWSKGIPRASDPDSLVVCLDGSFSSKSMTWDADGTTELAATVTSWVQKDSYTGTVTINTTFAKHESPFKTLTVTGNMTINGGSLTHPISALTTKGRAVTLDSLRSAYTYRLNIHAGSFSLGEQAKINLKGCGHYAESVGFYPSHGGRYEDTTIGCYGNVKYPEDIGLGSNLGTDSVTKWSKGGGAVRLKVDGVCTIDGEINVDGVPSSGSLAAGSAGSILIEANSVTGNGTGLVHADGVYCNNSSYKNGAPGRVAVLTSLPVDMTKVTFSASGSSSGKCAPCGTVFVKDDTMPNGVLYLCNRLNNGVNATPNRGTFVTSEEGVDWTFDRIVLGGDAQLYVPEGTTLTLANGFASIDATANTGTTRPSGIVCTGGTIAGVTGDQTLSGKWYFAPVSEFVFPGSLTLANGAYVGFSTYFEQALGSSVAPSSNAVFAIRCTVTGDMTVPADCGFSTEQAGPVQQSGKQAVGVDIGNHGGRQSSTGKTMDSVFNPILAPVGQSNSYGNMKPGAAMIVKVGGKLTMNGKVNANPINTQSGGNNLAAGGSINFTVGELDGNGTFEARGFRNKQCGGRIAVRLTKAGATFDDFTGSFQTHTTSGATSSTPGSIYLEKSDESDNRGVVYFDNRGTTPITLSVPICANGYGADDVESFKRASLVVRGGAYAQVAVANAVGVFKMKSVEIAANSKLDLNGKTFIVGTAKIGSVKLSPGTYKAADEAVSAYVVDTVGTEGSLVVSGSGMWLYIR